MITTIILSIITGILVGVIGMTSAILLYAKHEEKKKRKMIETFLNGLAEGLKQNEDDGK